jgi:hypothetical protein
MSHGQDNGAAADEIKAANETTRRRLAQRVAPICRRSGDVIEADFVIWIVPRE